MLLIYKNTEIFYIFRHINNFKPKKLILTFINIYIILIIKY